MIERRAQILPERQNVHTGAPQVLNGCGDLLVLFTEPEHETRLGQHLRPVALGVREQTNRLLVAGTRVANRMGQATNRFHVLRKDLKPLSSTVSTSAITPAKSGVSASTATAGVRDLTARMQAA